MSHRGTNIINRIVGVGTGIGAVALMAAAVLVFSNVVYRLFGHVIFGSYEITELLMVITVSFALAYATLMKSHVVVDLVISRFPEGLQKILGIIMNFISMCVWGYLGYAGYTIMSQRMMEEWTTLLEIPLMPFRLLWMVGLAIVCAVYLLEIVKSVMDELIEYFTEMKPINGKGYRPA